MQWKHYMALGDSLTAGVGDAVPGVENLSWADRLAQVLQPQHYTNLARRGQTSDDLLNFQLPVVLHERPDLVSVLVGGNDILNPRWHIVDFHSNYAHILGTLKEIGATVITTTMFDIRPIVPVDYLTRAASFLERVLLVNQVIREVSAEYRTLFVDLQTLPRLRHASTLSADLLHPNMRGYQIIADEVIQHVNDWRHRVRV